MLEEYNEFAWEFTIFQQQQQDEENKLQQLVDEANMYFDEAALFDLENYHGGL
jgi:hypothetical protein